MDNKKIGTVEPIGGVDGYNFILGAITKYSEDSRYHKSLLEYIKGISESNMYNDLC